MSATRTPASRLVLLGCGFVGRALARRALGAGCAVAATTRRAEHAERLRALGVEAVPGTLTPETLPELASARVVVSFPPDGHTDRAIAPYCRAAERLVYVSSTAVYGPREGRIDHLTPATATAPRAARRLQAERVWRDHGADIVRAPGIYGPGRGVHLRLLQGDYRLGAGQPRFVSRIHVDDLALILETLTLGSRTPDTYLVGDLQPTTDRELVQWLCEQLALPLPPTAAPAALPETRQGNRRVDPSWALDALQVTLTYPTYREGYASCIQHDIGDGNGT